jgi:hypothetical protein
MGVVVVRSEGVNVDSKGFAAGVALCFVLIGAWTYAMFWLTKWNLSMLSRVPALSYATVDLVWTYAWAVTMLALLLLVTLTIILWLMVRALRCSRC